MSALSGPMEEFSIKSRSEERTSEPEQVAVIPTSEPEPVAVIPTSEPEPVAVIPTSEPEPVEIEEPTQAEIPAEDVGKKIQPIEDISIVAVEEPEEVVPEPESQVPPQAQDFTPVQSKPVIQEAPPVVAMPEPEAEPQPEPTQQEDILQVASIPPSAKVPDSLNDQMEDATVIQPMSEIGIQEESIEDVAPVLHSIEFDPKSNRGEMISFKLNGFHPPVVFGIEEDIPRIVCFFKNTIAGSELNDMIGTNGRYVKNIKVGKYQNPDNIRVVLELVPGNNYDLQQIFFKDDKVFMMIINMAGKQISTQSN